MTSDHMAKIVGIDLGTTFSAIATLNDRGQAEIVPNLDGENITSSAIFFDVDGNVVVGEAARGQAQESPDRVATLIKRRMGHNNFGRAVAGREFRPETLSAIILRKLVQDAERTIGPISHAVITVPAYFDDTRRKATQDAGRIAGLEVLDILDEPTAAALAYSFRSGTGFHAGPADSFPGQPRTVLVYDLGGGTFDVTLVRLSAKRFEALAVDGDVRLGGKDWDDRVIDHVAAAFQRQHGEDPRQDPKSLALLTANAERAKRALSKLNQTSITCTHNGKVLTVPLTRADFEALTRDLLIRTKMTTQAVVTRQAGIGWDKVDRVLLVGGSTHMPMTGRMLQELSGKAPDNSLAVSEVVARGAAIHAGIVAARAKQDDLPFDAEAADALGQIVEINVNSHSLGLEIKKQQERLNDILIPKNTQLPVAKSGVYNTTVENQPRVRVKVLQGEASQADACISIGECWIDLPAGMPKGSPIQVRYHVGSDGLLDVMALDMTSGKIARAEIHRSSGLSEDEIAREAAWVRGLSIQ